MLFSHSQEGASRYVATLWKSVLEDHCIYLQPAVQGLEPDGLNIVRTAFRFTA